MFWNRAIQYDLEMKQTAIRLSLWITALAFMLYGVALGFLVGISSVEDGITNNSFVNVLPLLLVLMFLSISIGLIYLALTKSFKDSWLRALQMPLVASVGLILSWLIIRWVFDDFDSDNAIAYGPVIHWLSMVGFVWLGLIGLTDKKPQNVEKQTNQSELQAGGEVTKEVIDADKASSLEKQALTRNSATSALISVFWFVGFCFAVSSVGALFVEVFQPGKDDKLPIFLIMVLGNLLAAGLVVWFGTKIKANSIGHSLALVAAMIVGFVVALLLANSVENNDVASLIVFHFAAWFWTAACVFVTGKIANKNKL